MPRLLPRLTTPATLAACLLTLAVIGCPTVALAQEETATMTREELLEQYNALVEESTQLLEAEDYKAAVVKLSEAIRLTASQRPDPLVLRAKALLGLQDPEAAIQDLKEALSSADLVPGMKGKVRNERAKVYLEIGNIDSALRDAKVAIKEDRINPEYQLTYGKALFESGEINSAVKALTYYLEAAEAATEEQDQADLAEAYRLRGQANAGMGKSDKALIDLGRSLEIDPEEHKTYFIVALVYQQDKDFAPASEALKQAIIKYTPADPDDKLPNTQAILLRASTLEELGKQADSPEDAQKYYTEQKLMCEGLLGVLPEEQAPTRSGTLFRLGVAERLLGNLPAAVSAFSEAITINPAFGEAYFRRGICFYYLGEPRLALSDFEQGAAINFDSPRSNLWKGRCYAALNEFRDSIKSYSEAIAVSDRYVSAFIHRGLAYMQLGEYTNAVDDFNEAIRLQPTEGENYYYRGAALASEGNRDQAISSLMNAVGFSPKLKPAYQMLASELRAAGRSGLASEYQRKAAELDAVQ